MNILILVFFLVYFCEIQMVDASLFVCLCVQRERELFLERHYEETLVAS